MAPLEVAVIVRQSPGKSRPDLPGGPVLAVELDAKVLARKDRTIRTLVNAVLRDRKLSPSSAAAARDPEGALDALRSESSALAAMEAEARRGRTRRDAVGLQWDRALVALRLAARLVAAGGATQLYEILFRKPFPRYLP